MFQSKNGPKLVLVSESALKEADSEKFRANWGRSEFTPSELSAAVASFLGGGRCRITGAVIPPVTPQEAVRMRDEIVEDISSSISEDMPDATTEAVRKAAIARIEAWLPQLTLLAAIGDDEARGLRPPAPPGI